jgi:hypothetical protein
VSPPPDRPLKLGELLAETVRLYGERIGASFGLGAFVAGSLLLALATQHIVPLVALASIAFTASYAAAARLVNGDAFFEAWAQVGLRFPILLALTVIVSVPFVLGRIDPLLLIFAVAWLAFVGFSIPVAMLEREPGGEGWLGRLGFALARSVDLAKGEYLHSFGVAAALVLIYVLLGTVLAAALAGFADNGGLAATVIVQIVLGPFFFLGLAVLYFDQRARGSNLPAKREA